MANITCIRCETKNTKCVNDMLQEGYIAEVYRCKDCKGLIEVEYNGEISRAKIKSYRYRATRG